METLLLALVVVAVIVAPVGVLVLIDVVTRRREPGFDWDKEG